MIDFLKKLENFNEPKHSGLWGLTQVLMVYMDVPQVAVTASLWSKEKLIFITYFVHLLQKVWIISTKAFRTQPCMFQIKVKLDLEIFFKQIQPHFAFKDIFVVLIILYSNILYFANNFIGSPNFRARPFLKRDIA